MQIYGIFTEYPWNFIEYPWNFIEKQRKSEKFIPQYPDFML